MPEKEKEAERKDWYSEADWKKMGLEFVNFAQTSTQSALDTLNLLQDQSQRVLGTLVNQSMGVQQEYHKMFKEWSESAKKGTETYQKILDSNFKKAEGFFRA